MAGPSLLRMAVEDDDMAVHGDWPRTGIREEESH